MSRAREEARRYVRRKRIFFTVLGIYVILSILWFVIDILTGPDDLWFYWPMLGAGLGVAILGVIMFGVGGLFGPEWEEREVDKYLQRRGGSSRQRER